MKHRLFTLFVLFALLLAFLPAQPAQAETPASPLYASGDFLWAKRMGGTGDDISEGIAIDSNGNVYTTGDFKDTADFDPGAGTFNLTSAGNSDIFVSKLDSGGNLVWAKRMGGTGDDYGFEIAADLNGNVYTTGKFWGTADFDPGAGTFNLTSAGGDEIFVSKLDSSGNFVWAKRMGGTGDDYGFDIAVDSNSNVYTTGYFIGTADFDPGGATFNLISAGINDIFVSKLDSGGNFAWAKRMGGTGWDYGWSIAVDLNSNVYTTGYFEDTVDFNPGAGTFNLTSAGNYDIFVSKLDSNGGFVWAKRMGGTSNDYGRCIAVDSNGYVYTTGHFFDTADFDPGTGTFNLTSAGQGDIFVSKLDSSGNFVLAKSMGGTDDDKGHGIAVDSNSNVYTTGYFYGTADFDPGAGTFNLTSAGNQDIFVSKLDGSGNFVWAKRMGGTDYDGGYSIAIDSNGNVYTTGYFEDTVDFNPGVGTFNLTSAGQTDIFVSKLDRDEILTATFRSVGTYDGWILESGENTTAGGTLDSTATTFNLGDGAADKQYRAILHFNTSTLPDTAVITKVTLKIRKQGLVGTDPFTLLGDLKVDMRKPYFGANAGLVIGDFEAAAGRTAAATFSATPISNWYSAVLNATHRDYVNKTGNTQLRLYFVTDDNNDNAADYMKFFSGDYVTASARPTLVIEYYVP